MIGRDCKHTKRFPAEVPFVLLCRVCGEIGAHFPLEACLPDIAADDRHGAAIDLDHEATAGAIGQHKAEDKIGHKSDVMEAALVRDLHAERKGIACAERLIGKGGDHLVRMNKAKVSAMADGILERDVKIDDLKLVLDEGAAGLAVLAAPLDIGEIDAVALDQEARAAVGKGVGDRR